MNIDLSPIMEAVEDVIARHERYMQYGKRRRGRAIMRKAQKARAIVDLYRDSAIAVSLSSWPASVAVHAMASVKSSATISTPDALFCTDKPEIDPARQKAYNRANRAKRATTVTINYKGAHGYDVSGLVDRLNSELKGAKIQ